MCSEKPGEKPAREFPYYKLQYREKRVSAWMDVQKRFESTEDLLAHARSALEGGTRIRIVVVEGYGRRHILEGSEVSNIGDGQNVGGNGRAGT